MSWALMITGAVIVLAAIAAAVTRPARWLILLAAAGNAVTGAGCAMAATRAGWAGAGGTWAVGAYFAVQWARMERRARRR
jgi:hypothetical protein